MRFAVGLGGLAFLLALGALVLGFLPMWFVLSPVMTLAFAVRHPLLALVLGHQVEAAPAVAAALWSGAALVPLLCIAPLERVVVTAVTTAVLCFACLRSRRTREEGAREDRAHGVRVLAAQMSELLSRRVLVQRQVREWWELLPAPAVTNTADADETEDRDVPR